MICESLNCRRTADALEALSHDARDSENLRVPRVFKELCTQHILITERLDGIRLDHYLAGRRPERDDNTDSSSTVDGHVPDELARHLVEIWLSQTFTGSLMPIELRADQLVVRSSTEIAIVDGTFLTLPRVAKGNLLNYFCANASDEPSKALKSLLREFDTTHCKVSESVLDRQFRQVVAFRDGGWEDGGRANCLSDTLFAQWRLAARYGYRPLRHLAQTYRGTFHIAHLARQLAPHRDSFLEGVQDLRLTKLLHDIGTMMQPSYWGGQVDRLSFLPISIPGFLNDALWSIDNSLELQGRSLRDSAVQPKRSNGHLLVGLVTIAISLQFFDIKDLIKPFLTEISAAVGFVVVGLWLIRYLTK